MDCGIYYYVGRMNYLFTYNIEFLYLFFYNIDFFFIYFVIKLNFFLFEFFIDFFFLNILHDARLIITYHVPNIYYFICMRPQ